MLYVVAGNLIVYLLITLTVKNPAALEFLIFHLSGLLRGEVWRLVTFIFFPLDTRPLFLFLSLYFYYWIGSTLEREWGTARFTIYYFSGIIFTILGTILTSLITGMYFLPAVGATFVNLSLFLAFATIFPDTQILFFFIIPVKMKFLALLDVALFIYNIISSAANGWWLGVILPLVAMLNFLFFFWPELTRLIGIGVHKASPQTVNFRKAVRQKQQQKGYHHKCAVCGRTDVDHPDLQFRYCSKCAGYHCFCQDHIFTHVHFTE